MPDIVSTRETFILVTDENGLYPANDIYPSDDLFPKDAGLTQITNIVAGSLKLDEKIVEKIPQFGQLFASKFECKVYLTDDLSNKVIQVYQMDDSVYKPIFVGTIDSCKLDKIGTDRKIVAYDYAYTAGQINIAPWWTQFWNSRWNPSTEDYTPVTLKQCRDSMLSWAGISYENVSLPNDSLQVAKTVDLTNCSLANMLRMMCELSYCFPHFDRNGELIFIMLNTEPQQIFDLQGLYEWDKSDFEEFVTSTIDGVQFYDSGNELKYTVGTATNAYPIKQNIFLYNQGTQILINIGNDFLAYLEDLHYTPSKLKLIASDLKYNLGDFVHTEKGDFYIFQNAMSGVQLFEQQLKADGQPLLYGATPRMNYGEIILDEKIARVGYDLDAFKVEYGDYKEQVASEFIVSARSITSMVSKTQQEWSWNKTTYPVSLYGYHQPGTVDFTRYENYVAKEHQNAYYLDQTTGRIYKSEGSGSNWNWVYKYQCVAANQQLQSSIEQTASSIISTVSQTQKEWDTTGYTINIYGYQAPGAAGYPAASYNGKFYLNQTDGKIYKSNGSSWILQKSCVSIQSWTQSVITQTAGSLTSEINDAKGAASTAQQTAESITLSVTNGSTSSIIKLLRGSTQVTSKEITFTGYVKFTNLSSSGQTTINGGNITTGIIKGPNNKFSLDFSTGKVKMSDGEFTGKITGSTIQAGSSDGTNLNLYINNSSTIVGRRGTTNKNWISMAQGNTAHLVIDASESLDICAKDILVAEGSTSGVGASGKSGHTDSEATYNNTGPSGGVFPGMRDSLPSYDYGRECFRLYDVRKVMPADFQDDSGNPIYIPGTAYTYLYYYGLGEYAFPNPYAPSETKTITLPVFLRVRAKNERRLHGFVVDQDASHQIPSFVV